MSVCAKKTIIVVHFLYESEDPLHVTNKFCHMDKIPFDYELVYIPVKDFQKDNLKRIAEIVQASLNFCTAVLIKVVKKNLFPLIFFLKLMGEKMYRTILYVEQSHRSNEGFISSSFLKINNPEILKIYNIMDCQNQKVDFEVQEKHDKQFDYKLLCFAEGSLENDLKNPKLECQSWFKHYMNKAFHCVSGRLLQLSGTCYLNSVINGLFLSKGIQLLLKDIYTKEADKDFVEIDQLSCPVEQTKSSKKYILNLVDKILFNKQKIKGKFDIMINAAKSNFSGIGGFPFFTLLQILLSLQIQFVVKVPPFSNVYVLPDDRDYDKFKSLDTMKYLKSFPDKNPSGADIIIDYQPVEVYLTQNHLQKKTVDLFTTAPIKKKFNYIDYKLQFAIIKIFFLDVTHAVTGVFCNKKPAIFDSNNIIYDVDWTHFEPNVINFQNNLSEKLFHTYKTEPVKIIREAAIYMRESKITELKEI